MRQSLGVIALSLALLVPAPIVQAASEDDMALMKLEKLEKQIEKIKAMIKVRMMEGKKMPSDKMAKVMKMLEMTERQVDEIEESYEKTLED